LLDLLYFILGHRARSVFADFVYVDPKTPAIEFDGEDFVPGTTGQMEDHINLLLRFDDGVKGSVVLSEAAPGHKVELFLEIIGTKSCVAWNLQKINEMWIGHRTEPNGLLYKGFDLLYPEAQAVAAPPTWGQDGFSESFRQLCASVYQHIRDKKYLETNVRPDFADFHDGHYMEHVMRTMMRSSRSETWQEVGYTGP